MIAHWDPIQYARAQLYDTDPDTWGQRCRTCRRPPDRHDIACGGAIYFGLPRQAYPDYESPIGPITASEHRRQAERAEGLRRQANLVKAVYGGER